MVCVVTVLILNEEKHEDAARHPNSQAKNINCRIAFVSKQISHCNSKVASEYNISSLGSFVIE
jgi:hypothetical protein